MMGFKSLNKKFGAFRVKNNMIGFDNKGIIRVWVNTNFAKNHFNPFDHLASDSEESMIKNIIEIYEHFGYRN